MQAIAEGNAKAFEAMSGLQVEQIKFRQDARNNYLQGLSSVAGIKKHADIVIDNDKYLDDFLNEAIKKIGL